MPLHPFRLGTSVCTVLPCHITLIQCWFLHSLLPFFHAQRCFCCCHRSTRASWNKLVGVRGACTREPTAPSIHPSPFPHAYIYIFFYIHIPCRPALPFTRFKPLVEGQPSAGIAILPNTATPPPSSLCTTPNAFLVPEQQHYPEPVLQKNAYYDYLAAQAQRTAGVCDS